MKSTGRVFAEKPSIGIEPTRLYDASRRFKNHGTHTDVTMVRLPSGLWVRSFNGSSSKVTISDAPSLDISLGITLLVWVNVTARPGPDYAGIIDKEDALHPGGAYSLLLHTSGAPYFFIRNLADDGYQYPGDPSILTNGLWYHLANTFVSSTSIIGYQNGEVDTQKTTSVQTGIYTNASDLTLGYGTDSPYWLNGYLALPEILNCALSAGKIKQIFEAERHRFGV